MDRVEVKLSARALLANKQFFYVFFAVFIVGIFSTVFSVLASVVQEKSSALVWVGTVLAIIATLIEMPLSVGLCDYMLSFVKDKNNKKEYHLLFAHFNHFGEILKANLMILLYFFLGLICLVIPGIIVLLKYSLTNYILAEHPEYTYKKAMVESGKITEGRKGEIFTFFLSFFWWYMLVAVTCGIAVIYVEPYIQTAFTLYYNKIKPDQIDEQNLTKEEITE